MPKSLKVKIRPAVSGDESEIAQVHIKAWQEAYQDILPKDFLDRLSEGLQRRIDMWKSTLASPDRWAWVVENEKGVIVGFALFGPPRDSHREEHVELGAIYLLAAEKGKGVGFSLLSTGFQEMKERGYKKAYCWVLENNPTIEFYKSTGAIFSHLTKDDEIGGQKVKELAYEWNSLDLSSKKIQNWDGFKLHLPNLKFKEAFLNAFRSLSEKSEKIAWVYLGEKGDLQAPENNFEGYVKDLRQRRRNPPPGFVCDTTYWAIYNGEMIGRISIRHELNEFLREVGGHIGYIVHPRWRKRGVATWMLAEILKTEKARSIQKVLLTCDENNIGSQKTIINNGGIYERSVEVSSNRPKKMHFWISI